MTNTKKETVEQVEGALKNIRQQKAAAGALAEKAAKVRSERSYDATQGDCAAIAALKKAETDDHKASVSLRSLESAEREAKSRLENARQREAAEAREAAKLRLLKAQDELLSQDQRALRVMRTLRRELDKRGEFIRAVLAINRDCGELKPGAESRLTSGDLLAEALGEILGDHLGRHRAHVSDGAATYFVEGDLKACDRMVPARQPLNALENEMVRSLKPSRFRNAA